MCHQNLVSTKSGLFFKDFEQEVAGKKIRLFTIYNKQGVEASITNFGLRLVALLVPDKHGDYKDIVLGHKKIDQYIKPEKEFYIGAVIGRYANRIANGKFLIDENEYFLKKNNGNNHLHGGDRGFHRVVWDTNQLSESEIEFSYCSRDMEQGYPGNLLVTVTYRLLESNALEISYRATTDKKTIVNLTSHPYFNLAGEGKDLNQHLFRINADCFTPITNDQVPNGERMLVKETPFDFRQYKKVTTDLISNDQQIQYGNGFDHNFVLNSEPLNSEGLVFAARVQELQSKIGMEVYTNKPGIQLYTGNFLDGSTKGKQGQSHQKRSGFCLEAQNFPDAPNQLSFPNAVLKPKEVYTSKTVYSFLLDI